MYRGIPGLHIEVEILRGDSHNALSLIIIVHEHSIRDVILTLGARDKRELESLGSRHQVAFGADTLADTRIGDIAVGREVDVQIVSRDVMEIAVSGDGHRKRNRLVDGDFGLVDGSGDIEVTDDFRFAVVIGIGSDGSLWRGWSSCHPRRDCGRWRARRHAR